MMDRSRLLAITVAVSLLGVSLVAVATFGGLDDYIGASAGGLGSGEGRAGDGAETTETFGGTWHNPVYTEGFQHGSRSGDLEIPVRNDTVTWLNATVRWDDTAVETEWAVQIWGCGRTSPNATGSRTANGASCPTPIYKEETSPIRFALEEPPPDDGYFLDLRSPNNWPHPVVTANAQREIRWTATVTYEGS